MIRKKPEDDDHCNKKKHQDGYLDDTELKDEVRP